jgi:hypothetical protein
MTEEINLEAAQDRVARILGAEVRTTDPELAEEVRQELDPAPGRARKTRSDKGTKKSPRKPAKIQEPITACSGISSEQASRVADLAETINALQSEVNELTDRREQSIESLSQARLDFCDYLTSLCYNA